jgi:hypothetical protein
MNHRTIEEIINSCEKCPHARVSKVYSSDSFEDVRSIHCNALGKVVHGYLDTWDKSPIPSYCPQKVKESEPMKMTIELSEKEVETAIKYYLEHVEKVIVKSVKVNVGQTYVGYGMSETLTASFQNVRCEVEK